jgi:ATP-dependent exoDNAse (exonuclease V) beta subunit
MGNYIYKPFMGSIQKHGALASLGKWTLERDDTGTIYPHRIYKDAKKNIYHSVTHILKETAPQEQKDALERWIEREGSADERDMACERGKLAHAHAEYLLKTGAKLARYNANKRGIWNEGADELERCPKKVTQWALSKAAETAPRVNWSASGYARGLRSFILERVTAIHAIEFSVHDKDYGYAGTADALVDIDGKLTICDWKTSKEVRSEEMLTNYCHQLGAYNYALRKITGIECSQALICIARRSGKPQLRLMNNLEVRGSEIMFMERCLKFKEQLKELAVV